MEKDEKELIYGKDDTINIVSIEIINNKIILFREVNGKILTEIKDNKYWVLSSRPSKDNKTKRLTGEQHFKYIKEYDKIEEFNETKRKVKKLDLYCIYNPVEGAMVRYGYTYFKNTKITDISILSFDIETTGLNPKALDAKVYIITNTFRKLGVITKKIFSIDEFSSEKEMLLDWVNWVREMDPSIILGYNINGFDFPYLIQRAWKNGIELELGRDGSSISKENFERKFRKDGSQEYSYNRLHIFGRSVIDGFFVAIRYDISRKYSSYKLKTIISEEGLEKEGRTFIDASKIKEEWKDLEKRKLIKKYAEEDSDDALKLFDLMVPSQFYLSQYIPKSFQVITESATGAQINGLMVRSYLQNNGSIPKSSEIVELQGAISFAIPGIYDNIWKVDATALYPSIIREYSLYDKKKDPKAHFLKIIDYFTLMRVENKKRAKDTGDRYFKDLEQSQKILCNSGYGFTSANGLQYNSPEVAKEITAKGREILTKAIFWATSRDLNYWLEKLKEKA